MTITQLTLAQFAITGGFDGARLTLYRAYMPKDQSLTPAEKAVPVGVLVQFVGRVGDVEATRTQVTLHVNSDLELLNINLPRNLYQAQCQNTLYDNRCTLDRTSYAVSGVINDTSTRNLLKTNLANADGYFDHGIVNFASVGDGGGANAGLSRTIKYYASGELHLSYPLPVVPELTDAFIVYPGCDKLQTTCKNKFQLAPNSSPNGNIAHFRGFPFIPSPESSY